MESTNVATVSIDLPRPALQDRAVTWVWASLAAGIIQAGRNGLARSLPAEVSPALNSWARFAFNLPFSASLAAALILAHGVPVLSPTFFLGCLLTAVTQLLGNSALVAAFRHANFAQSITLHKAEVVFAAVIGLVFFLEPPTLLGWAGVALSTAGALLINLGRESGPEGWRRAFYLDSGALLALAAGLLFALAGFALKYGSSEFALANPRVGDGRFEAAAHTLVHTTWIEVVLLSIWLPLRQSRPFAPVARHWRRMTALGFCAFSASLCWFWACSVALVAYVKAVGQIEVLIAILLSLALWKEREVWRQVPGIAVLLLGIGMVVLG